MTAAAIAPARPKSLLGHLGAAWRDWRGTQPRYQVGDLSKTVLGLLRHVIAFAVDHGLTVTALGLIDTGAFRGSLVAGYIVTGLSVLVFEHKVGGG